MILLRLIAGGVLCYASLLAARQAYHHDHHKYDKKTNERAFAFMLTVSLVSIAVLVLS